MLGIAEQIFSRAKLLRYLSLRYHESELYYDNLRWIEAGTFELVEERPRVLAVHEVVMNEKTKESRFYRAKIGEEI
jgi:hypothetical protein